MVSFSFPPFACSRPDFLYLFAVLPLFWLWQRQALRSFGAFVGLLIHSLVGAVLILAAAGLHTLKPGVATAPLLVLDLSGSMDETQRQWVRDTIARQLQPSPATPTFVFAGRWRKLPWQEAEILLQQPPADLHLEASNLEVVFTGLLAEGHNRNVYLFTDGWETQGDVRSLLPLLAEQGLKVYPFPPPPATVQPNVTVQRVNVPRTAASGEAIEVNMALENTHPQPVRGELILRQKDTVAWQKEVTLPPGTSLFSHILSLSDSGLIPLQVSFTTTGTAEATSQDNQLTAWVKVAPAEKVLLLSAKERDNVYLEKALRARGLGVTAVASVIKPAAIPLPDSFGVIILNNIAKEKLPPTLVNGLDDYVRRGGGLIMIGGEESLGLGGYKDTPVEKALPVILTPPQKAEPRTAMLLVIDKSGSMRKENRLLYAIAGARMVARNLKDTDLFGVIGFDREPFIVIPLSPLGAIRHEVDDRIDRLKAAGGTFLLPALLEAKRQLERQDATRKHIVILTDGETGGSGSEYLDLVTAMQRELKITISAIAVGEQPNLRLLSRIANYGGGAFHHTADPSSLPDLFLEELGEEGEEKTMVERALTPIAQRDSPLLSGLDRGPFPPVKGYVETEAKKGARTDIVLPVDGKRPPLLASWSYGQGKAVAFTSDANGRWSAPWVSWEGFSKFWAQVVRWCLPELKRQESHFSVELGHDERGLLIDVFSHGAQEEGRTVAARVSGPRTKGAAGRETTVPLERLAPGHYQAAYAVTTPGDYRVEVILPTGEKLGPLGYTLPPQRSWETPQPQPNLELLETIARLTGGSLSPDISRVEQPVGPPEPQSFLPYLIPLAMILYFVELLVRRIV
jgi:Ca-activated chloride channel family protein